jgi:hypothetical protein
MSILIGVGVLGATVAGLGVTASVQSTAPEPLRNKAAIERAFAAWKDGTGSPLDLLAAAADTVVAFFDARGVARDGKPYE